MSAGQPLWLKAVLRLERAIGEPVETVAHSNTYFDAVAVAVRLHARRDRRGRGRFAALPAPRQPPRRHRPAARPRAALADRAPAARARRRPALNPGDVIGRVNRDVERSLLRARNGLRYVRGSHRPKLGTTPKDVVWRGGRAQLWRYRRPSGRSATAHRSSSSTASSAAATSSTSGRATAPWSSSSTQGSTCSCSTGASPTSATRRTRSRPMSTATCRARSRPFATRPATARSRSRATAWAA